MRDVRFWDTTWSKPYGKRNRHHEAIWKAILPYCQGAVVDFGCGPCVMYQGKDINLTGVDFSEQAIVEARKNYPNGRYIVSDVTNVPFPSFIYDCTVAWGLLDYFEDWTRIVSEMKRVTKPSGRVFATLLNGYNDHRWGELSTVVSYLGYIPRQYIHIAGQWYFIEI